MARGGYAVAYDGESGGSGWRPGCGERHRVLVAAMPETSVGNTGQQPEVDLGVVVAGGHLAAARLAITFGGHPGLRARGASGRGRRSVAAHPGRPQFGPACLAEVVLRPDRRAARRA